MLPTYIKRKRSAVRSYTCRPAEQQAGAFCSSGSVSATLIENTVLAQVALAAGTTETGELATPRTSIQNAVERIIYSGATGRVLLQLRQAGVSATG